MKKWPAVELTRPSRLSHHPASAESTQQNIEYAGGEIMNTYIVRSAMVAAVAVSAPAVYAQTAPADPAQAYPARSIRFIAPYPAGGTSDILGRLIGQKMTEKWGQQILIEARPGAAGLIGTETVSRAQPDGYTLLITDMGSVLISYLAQAKPAFDYLRDLTPVMALTFSPHVLCSHPSLPVTNLKELI